MRDRSGFMGIPCCSRLVLFAFFSSMIVLFTPASAREKPARARAQELIRLKQAAAKGDAQAQLAYGKALCEADQRPEGAKWLQRAADQGNAEAWFQLGYRGAGSEQPVNYYEKAAEKGYPEAFGYLLDDLLFRAGAKADVAKAKRFGDLARKLNVSVGWGSDGLLATVDRCYEAGRPKIPASDQPTAREARLFKEEVGRACERYRRGPRKYLARYGKCVVGLLGRCVISTCKEEDETDYGRVLLAEVYANGWGVKRNPTLAISLVCHGSSVPGELEGMVENLYKTRDQQVLKKEFSFCDHVTSGMNGGQCAAWDADAADEQRERAFKKVSAKWSAAQRQALSELRRAGYAFFDKHSTDEQDMTGSARVEIAFQEENALKDELLKVLRELEAGKLPAALDAVKVEREHAAVYGRLMKRKKLCDYCTITSAGVREVQQRWLSYRNAWVKLGAARWPRTSASTWKAWVTARRTKQLSDLTRQPSQ